MGFRKSEQRWAVENQKSYIYEVCLFSSVFNQLYSTMIFCTIALINFFFENASVRKRSGRGVSSTGNIYKQGGRGLQKRAFLCECKNPISLKGNIGAAGCFENNTLRLNTKKKTKTRGKPQAPTSSYLVF